MRVVIKEDPSYDRAAFRFEQSSCPGWIWHPYHIGQRPVVIAYRCRFSLPNDSRIRFHVSADERYELFLDGVRIGRGPERSDVENWFYETHDLELEPGDHLL